MNRTPSIVETLGSSSLFHDLPEEAITALAPQVIRTRFRRKSRIISVDDESDTVYVIESGTVRVYRDDPRGREITLNGLGPGDFFGELAPLASAPRIASVDAQEDCVLLGIPGHAFLGIMRHHPDLLMRLAKTLVDRVRDMTIDVSDLALLDVYGRVARVLLREAAEEDDRRVVRALTHQEIANRVGASREMVSRIMKDLRDGGYIETDGRAIILRRDLPAGW